MLRVTDLKQWAYCRRIVYYQHRMPGAGAPTYKMQEGRRAQELIERLEVRRTLREYGLDAAERRFGLWLEDQRRPGRKTRPPPGCPGPGRYRRVQAHLR